MKPFCRNILFVHAHFVFGYPFCITTILYYNMVCITPPGQSKNRIQVEPSWDADLSCVGINSSTLRATRHCLTPPSRQTCGSFMITLLSFNMREIRTPMRREASGRLCPTCIWCIATSTTWPSELKASHQKTPGMPRKPMRMSLFPFGIRRARP